MNREQLSDPTERVNLVAGVELPVIVGAQSLYGVTPHVPDIVKRSVEGDLLLLAVGSPAFRAVIGMGRLTRGVVKDVPTKSSHHPHGIKVGLETGEVGEGIE